MYSSMKTKTARGLHASCTSLVRTLTSMNLPCVDATGRSLGTLCALTASITALNLRTTTHVLDAVYAIVLVEESWIDLTGRSVLGLQTYRKLQGSALSVLTSLEDAPLATLYKHVRNSIAQFVDKP